MKRSFGKKIFKLAKVIIADIILGDVVDILTEAAEEVAKTRKPGDTSRDDIKRYPKAVKNAAVEWFYKQIVNFRNTVNWFKNFKMEAA